MAKVLILAYDFPPHISIGALRPNSWYNYFPQYGVETTLVTRHWDKSTGTWQEQISASNSQQVSITEGKGKKLIRVPFIPGFKEKMLLTLQNEKYKRVRQLITFLYSYLEYFGMLFDSRANIYCEAKKELQNNRYDYIIATGRPFILFKYASRLAREFNIPWIADYRDSWTLNHVQGGYSLNFTANLLNNFYKLCEKRYLSTAALITTAAPSYGAVMPPYFPKEKIRTVYNGYDDEVAESVQSLSPRSDKFIISYAGTIYRMQKLEMFLEGLRKFISAKGLNASQLEVHFWGLKEDAASVQRVENYNSALLPYLQIHGKLSYRDVMKELSAAQLLLLLVSGSNDWLNAKLFDYLALKRRILMVGNINNVMSGIINENRAGTCVENADDVSAYLEEAYKSFVSGNNMAIEPLRYRQYSRKSQALVFSQLLNSQKV